MGTIRHTQQVSSPFALIDDPIRDICANAAIRSVHEYISAVLVQAGIDNLNPQQRDVIDTLLTAIFCCGWDVGAGTECNRLADASEQQLGANTDATTTPTTPTTPTAQPNENEHLQQALQMLHNMNPAGKVN